MNLKSLLPLFLMTFTFLCKKPSDDSLDLNLLLAAIGSSGSAMTSFPSYVVSVNPAPASNITLNANLTPFSPAGAADRSACSDPRLTYKILSAEANEPLVFTIDFSQNVDEISVTAVELSVFGSSDPGEFTLAGNTVFITPRKARFQSTGPLHLNSRQTGFTPTVPVRPYTDYKITVRSRRAGIENAEEYSFHYAIGLNIPQEFRFTCQNQTDCDMTGQVALLSPGNIFEMGTSMNYRITFADAVKINQPGIGFTELLGSIVYVDVMTCNIAAIPAFAEQGKILYLNLEGSQLLKPTPEAISGQRMFLVNSQNNLLNGESILRNPRLFVDDVLHEKVFQSN